jgi:hypothetical protein
MPMWTSECNQWDHWGFMWRTWTCEWQFHNNSFLIGYKKAFDMYHEEGFLTAKFICFAKKLWNALKCNERTNHLKKQT